MLELKNRRKKNPGFFGF